MKQLEHIIEQFQTNEQVWLFLGIDRATMYRWQTGAGLMSGSAVRLINVLNTISDEAPDLFEALVELAREKAPPKIAARRTAGELARADVERLDRKEERDAAMAARREAKRLRRGSEPMPQVTRMPVKPLWDDSYWFERTAATWDDTAAIVEPESVTRAMSDDDYRRYADIGHDYCKRTGRIWPD